MTATFTKLKTGEWGIRVVGPVKVGDTVTVTKKSGDTKRETVGRVLWTGDGVSLCTIASTTTPTRSSYTPRTNRVSSEYCGGICPVGGHRCCAKNGPCHDCE